MNQKGEGIMDKVSRNFSGTPWHIEKVKGEGIRDNTNCVFNYND